MNTCGAKTRIGTPCKRRPCENGRCALHGGKSLRGSESPTFKHGLYAIDTPHKIQSKVNRFIDADPFDLTSELALLRAMLAEFLSRFEYANLDQSAIYTVSNLINEIGRFSERIAKIKNDSALTAAEVTFLAIRATEIVHRYIDDPEKRQAFIEDLFAGVEAPDSARASETLLLQPR